MPSHCFPSVSKLSLHFKELQLEVVCPAFTGVVHRGNATGGPDNGA